MHKVIELAEKVKGWVLDILFPISSLPVGIKLNQTLFCPTCRARLPNNTKICHKKSQYKLGAASSYSDAKIRRLIWQLKYRGRTGNSVCLGILLTDYLKNLGINLKNYSVIPVPISKNREQKRGYNHAKLIAKIISGNFNLPLEEEMIFKNRETLPQAEVKDWEERKKNLKDCFSITDAAKVKNKNFIIVDDVFTSGATLNEIARVLKSSGARKILGLVVAKAG